MQFLSVAGRELRVAARKRSSFTVRMLVASLALFISGFSLWFVTLWGSKPLPGEQLFRTLSWVALMCVCLVGPALTSDCVNEEQNNGTLGLLFLTHLHGVSILLGKLAGHGLLALYSIVAIIPVMALPALLGGADAASLAKTALVLCVALCFSLIVGLFASTVCRKPWMAAATALAILGVLVVGIPPVASALRVNRQVEWSVALELLSPSYALAMAGPSVPILSGNHFWLALGAQAMLALGFFGASSFLVSQVWREGKSGVKAPFLASVWRGWKYGSGEGRRRVRSRLLEVNPILWLSSRERFGPMGFALVLVSGAWAISQATQHFHLSLPSDFLSGMVVWIMGIVLLYICFCFRLAVAASERFAADRKAGALELILCTPMKVREIIRGHWLGLVRRFWGALLVLAALHAFGLNYIMEAIRIEGRVQPFELREVVVQSVRHVFGGGSIPNDTAPFYVAGLAVLTSAVLIVVLWIALGWLGMALALTLRKQVLAPWVALFLLAVPPLPVFVGAVALLDNKQIFANNLFLALLRVGMSGFFIVLANALLWLFLARRRTYQKLQESAVFAFGKRGI